MIDDARPFVTVVIPTYERPQALGRCLTSLSAQDYPHDRFEVIVVNDGGATSLAEVVDAHRKQVDVALVAVPHGGPAAARNRGAAAGRGEILAFIDDDCTADGRWISMIVAALCEHPPAAIGGQVANGVLTNPYARASHTLLAFLYRYYHVNQQGLLPFFTTNNLAVRADVFAQVGGFDVAFPFASEDREWCDRCRSVGYPLVYAQRAVVHHAPNLSFARFIRMHFRYGEGAWRFYRVRARRGEQAEGFESVDFYTGMLHAPFVVGDPEPRRQSLLLILSQAIAALGFVWAALRPARDAGAGGQKNVSTSRGSRL
jgi:GT2 family glycosyltransferase